MEMYLNRPQHPSSKSAIIFFSQESPGMNTPPTPSLLPFPSPLVWNPNHQYHALRNAARNPPLTNRDTSQLRGFISPYVPTPCCFRLSIPLPTPNGGRPASPPCS
ncbi:hypothetical protein VaNZ11_013290 [Volvox africanus]|uniref:Uncharacterized protein n=1 Tax=Volvox africanus TaxID=51714 RepID=A0ABQ5SFS5_9CHLO|nr:hypothetical protein VaNZ11_013290 [Volvox africanus]